MAKKKKKVRPAPKKTKSRAKKAAKKKRPVAKKKAKRKIPAPALSSPIPVAWLVDEAGRELALDSLAAWVVSTLQAAQDDASAKETLQVAIKTFYDIRESANQPRGEYAGHFFIVDAVGLAASNRPVPWQVLAETVSQERLSRFSAIFEEAEREVG